MKSLQSINFDQTTISQAVECLRNGELVAFPTETVYGLGADANNEQAINKLYATKGRPGNHPVIVHLASFEQINDWCEELPQYARLLAKNFWPGPLTLIGKKAKHVSGLITGGQDTVGIRVPAHPIALALLKAFGGGIAAPSANKYGRISSTCAEHVHQEFGDEISVIIDGGSCPVGIESTIVDVTGPNPKILRPGIISEKDLLDKIDISSGAGNSFVQARLYNSGKNIRVPGSDKSHYAPQTPLLLLDRERLESLLCQQDLSRNKLSYALLSFDDIDHLAKKNCQVNCHIKAPMDVASYARNLYANLRNLDASKANYILVEMPPKTSEWLAIVDRLNRASTKL